MEEATGHGTRFDDQPGDQPFAPGDIPADREVITYPLDPPVKSLLQDIRTKLLIVNPPFQRQDVWDKPRKSRLIESLLLNIPIPVLFLAEDQDGTRVVVDGQQRLRAIEQFEAGLYALSGLKVLSSLNGMRWADLTPKQARLVLNRPLRCIVIGEKSDPNLRFEVFERLNSFGVTLNDQELRNSLYRGSFNAFLDDVAHEQSWLTLVGRERPDSRLQHHEMILRFFAFLDGSERYKPPLKSWLNDYMKDHRDDDLQALRDKRIAFQTAARAVGTVFLRPGVIPFRRARTVAPDAVDWDHTLNRPVFELQMLGLMGEPPAVLQERADDIVAAFAHLCVNDTEFSDALSRATADKARTRLRFERWGRALTDLGITTRLLERLPADE